MPARPTLPRIDLADRPRFLTTGLLRLVGLCAVIVGIGMLPGHLTPTKAGVIATDPMMHHPTCDLVRCSSLRMTPINGATPNHAKKHRKKANQDMWNARIAGGIRNMFDEDPPVAFSAFANSFDPQYDVPGRFWYVNYTQKF